MPIKRNALVYVAVLLVFTVLLHGRIPQDPAYHQFADTRSFAGIPNFWDVMSNLPFLLVGLHGLTRVRRLAVPETRSAYLALCAGVLLVSFGSAYYHWVPSTPALLWDRLPMTVAFMSLFSLLLDERVLSVPGRTLWPLLIAGVVAALYWRWTDDLRPYVLVQFLPILLSPLILLLFPRKYLYTSLLAAALVLYSAAKACEHYDRQVLEAIVMLSGHTIKHLLAGAATLCLILAIPVTEDSHASRIKVGDLPRS
jgi:hypothetical protein